MANWWRKGVDAIPRNNSGLRRNHSPLARQKAETPSLYSCGQQENFLGSHAGGDPMQSDYALTGVATTSQAAPAIHVTSDENLIREIANGDKRAMRVLYARHNVRVFRFI